MIVLDTNALSELGCGRPHETVASCAAQLDVEEVHLTAISRAEVRTGLAGRPISGADAQIAALARATGATLATRNVGEFDGVGVAVVNPWESAT
jgi:predicted nucleic acid-binding protein